MKVFVAIVCAASLAMSSSPAKAADPAKVYVAKRALEHGAYAKTVDGMIAARADLEKMSAAEPKSALLHYWMTVADWRLAPRLMDKKTQADRFVKDGLKHADLALRLDPKMAEVIALKASLQGLSIQIDPGNMMSVGPEIAMGMQHALALSPGNPRVLLLDAMGTLHKPAFVGGGADRALPKFKKSQELFDAEKADLGAGPDWGRFEAYAWAGKSAAQLGNRDGARAFYAKALEIDPQSGWVRHVLLPELDRPDSTMAPPDSSSASPDSTVRRAKGGS